MRLFREPDAGNPPVRFDEREEETELSQTGLRRRGESLANRHREATVTAPLLDSTQNVLAWPLSPKRPAFAFLNQTGIHKVRVPLHIRALTALSGCVYQLVTEGSFRSLYLLSRQTDEGRRERDSLRDT